VSVLALAVGTVEVVTIYFLLTLIQQSQCSE
jgi:hypothetical protein